MQERKAATIKKVLLLSSLDTKSDLETDTLSSKEIVAQKVTELTNAFQEEDEVYSKLLQAAASLMYHLGKQNTPNS